MASHHQIESLLIDLEAALRNSGLWAVESPGAAALASTEPFAVDTMELQQWLQFIFLPRMQQLLESGAAMPAISRNLPVAEEVFDRKNQPLFAVIRQLDKLISEA